MIHTSDMLNDLIATSTSTPKHTMITDMDQVSTQLHDMCELYGYKPIEAWLTAWLRGKEQTEMSKCEVCGAQCRVESDNSDENEVNIYYVCPKCGWDERNV